MGFLPLVSQFATSAFDHLLTHFIPPLPHPTPPNPLNSTLLQLCHTPTHVTSPEPPQTPVNLIPLQPCLTPPHATLVTPLRTAVGNDLSGGVDPCHKTPKWLSWNATCKPSATSDTAAPRTSTSSMATRSHAALAQSLSRGDGSIVDPSRSNGVRIASGFGGAISKSDFNVTAWRVNMVYDPAAGASMGSSDPSLDAVWELCR
jgi:hypothetical protein